MLTKIQKKVAQSLAMIRPDVLPGTRAIIDRDKAKAWYGRVSEAMEINLVKSDDVQKFCDIAGVAD